MGEMIADLLVARPRLRLRDNRTNHEQEKRKMLHRDFLPFLSRATAAPHSLMHGKLPL
jgi:hypothetical protein